MSIVQTDATPHRCLEIIKDMEPEQSIQFESIFEQLSLGVAVLDADELRISYANPFLHALLDEPWRHQDIVGQCASAVLPSDVAQAALPLLHKVLATGNPVYLTEVPYEGFIESRGRTYWHISIEPTPSSLSLTLEDMTESVRSRLHLSAIHHISAVI